MSPLGGSRKTSLSASKARSARAAALRGEVPVGAVVTRGNDVIGRGGNRTRELNDPTAHAEVDAIRDACRKAGVSDLAGAVCYTTMEPCPMCCWAIEAAGCAGLGMGARHGDFSGSGVRDYKNYSVEAMIASTGASYTVVTGVEHETCRRERQAWLDANK